MSFPRYPKYKASGVEWLGDVPEHWEVKPNKAFLTLRKSEVGSTWSQKTLLSLTLHGVISRDMESGKGKFPSDFSSYQDVDANDLIFCLFDMDETPRTVGLAKSSGMITGAYDVFQCRVLLARPQFILYYYLYIDAFKALRPFYTGLRKVVRPPTFLAIKIPLPPLEEQTAIAAFLDHETAKIDELVSEQERLIELLKEKRQAVISHAVTKGLNPDAPMKDSGIEWLGEVPEHWEVCDLNYALSAIGDIDHYMPESVDKGVPYVMTGDLTDFASGIDFESCKQVSHNDYLKLSKRIKSTKGDVVMARYATIGTASFIDVDREFLVSYSCVTIKPNPSKALGLYIFNYFKSLVFFQGIQQQVNTNTQGNVGVNDLKKIKVTLPNLTEQAEIIEYLAFETAKFTTLTTEANRVIDLLKERRTALISAAVTGQIDVRNLVSVESA